MSVREGPSFGALLRRYRKMAGLTQEELAERALLSAYTVSALERGSSQSPRKDTLDLLADALGLAPPERAALAAAARGPEALAPPAAVPGPPAVMVLATPEVERAAAEAVVTALAAQGLPCWPAWAAAAGATGREALRAQMRASGAVLLLYTAGAAATRAITAAVELGALYGRPLIAACLGGAREDAALAGVAERPDATFDLRGPRYEAALLALVAHLRRAGETLPGPDTTSPDVPAARNPYKGLRAFRAEDAGDFFGRERLIAELLEAARRFSRPGATRFLAVVGPSGSGKSSVVLAGLLPRLRGGALPGSVRWTYLDPLLPGAHPLEALSVALANALPHSSLSAIRADLDASERGLHLLASRLARAPEDRVVLLVDQAEELFTLTTDEEERRRFIDLLVTAVSEPRGPLLALLTLRADFYDRPMSYIQLGRLVDAQSLAVLPLEPGELRAAIEGPARLPDVGLAFEGDLVGDLLYEVRGQAGALPLLQFILDQLYERRQGRLLTEGAYRELGGVRGALARQAEATYQALPDEEHRRLARALSLRLIEPGASAQETTRRRVSRAELQLADAGQTARLGTVAEAFVGARLLTASERGGERTLEVSHEALIREWTRLGAWLAEAREDVQLQGRLSADAAEWEKRGRPADALYRGTVLAEAHAWAGRNTPSAREAAFLDAATAEEHRFEEAERERQARELAVARQAATRLRALTGVLAAFLLAAGGLSALALHNADQASEQAQRANEQSQRAVAARDVALSRQLAAQAVTRLNGQYDLGVLLGLEAQRIAHTVEARASLLQALQAAPPGLIAFLRGHTLVVTALAHSPDGKVLASGSNDGTIRLWDLARRAPLGMPLRAGAAAIASLAFSPHGAILAAGANDGATQLWDVAHRRALGTPLRVPFEPNNFGSIPSLAFSPDGRLLASGCTCGHVYLWDIPRQRQIQGSALTGEPDNAPAVALPWAEHATMMDFGGLDYPAVAFSPDGQTLAVGAGDGVVYLWTVTDARRLTPSGRLTAGSGGITSLAFSPNGRVLAAGSLDHTIHLWDVPHRQPLGAPLRGHGDFVLSLTFSPDGAILASGSLDASVRLWDVRQRRAVGPPLLSHSGEVDGVVFSPDGATLAAATADGAIALWDVRPRRSVSHIVNAAVDWVHQGDFISDRATHMDSVNSLAYSPHGAILAVGTTDGHIEFWDMRRGRERSAMPTLNVVTSVAFGKDNRFLAVATLNGVQLWDAAAGAAVGDLVSTQDTPTSVAVSPDSRTVVTGAGDGSLQFWSIVRRPNGQLRPLGSPLVGHRYGVRSVAFSPDGKLVASAGGDGAIRLWDVAHRTSLGPPLRGPSGGISSVAFSPDGRMLASAGDDSTIRLWDVTRRMQLRPLLMGHVDAVRTLAFSPDGLILASGGSDNTVRLWDVATGQPLGPPLAGFADTVTGVAFSPDGRTLVAGSWDGTIHAWDVDLGGWPRRACRIANRNLTRQEWRQYLGNTPYRKTCPGLPAGS